MPEQPLSHVQKEVKRLPDIMRINLRWILVVCLLLLSFLANRPDGKIVTGTSLDDAFITYRYARNLASGVGLAYSSGIPPVEGYSNFLELILLTVFAGKGGNFATAGQIHGLVFATLLLGFFAITGVWRFPRWGWLFPLALLWDPWFRISVWNGLETTQYSFLVTVAAFLLERVCMDENRLSRVLTGLWCGLCVISRLEFLAWFGIFLTLLATFHFRQPSRVFRYALWLCVGFVIVLIPYFAFRYIVFDSLVPNVYPVKMAMLSNKLTVRLWAGRVYLLLFMVRHPVVLSVTVFLVTLSVWRRIELPISAYLLAAGGLVILLSGGDWPHMYDQLRYLIPILCVLLYLNLSIFKTLAMKVAGKRNLKAYACATSLAAVFAMSLLLLAGQGSNLPAYFLRPDTISIRENLVALRTSIFSPSLDIRSAVGASDSTNREFNRLAGLWVRDHTEEKELVASVQAGAFGFFVDRPLVDLLGLNDRKIALLFSANQYGNVTDYLRELQIDVFAMYSQSRSFSGTFVDEKTDLYRQFFSEEDFRLTHVLIAGDMESDSHCYFIFRRKGMLPHPDDELVCADPPECDYRVPASQLLNL